MNKKIYFVSGLPRSGSTLLVNIFNQNPRFEVSKSTSGLHDVLFGIRNQWDNLIEHKAQAGGADYERLRRVMLASVEAYYNTEKPIILDKGRGWLSLIEMIEFMGIDPKILVPVRNVSEILASFEKLWRKTTGQSQWNLEKDDYIKSQTAEGRCDIWSRGDQVVGLAYNRLKDSLVRGHRDRLHFVEFDELTANPEKKLREIYNFLDEDFFSHDFLNVQQYTQEDDENVHRIPNLHKISSVVRPLPKVAREVLGNDIYKKYQGAEFWRGV